MIPVVVYLEDYKPEEEAALKDLGISTVRCKLEDALEGRVWSQFSTATSLLFRGPRLSPDTYETLYTSAQALGASPITTPRSYRIADDFSLHYPLLRNQSPAALVVAADVGADELLENIENGNLAFPLFVRSDLESAAKY